MTVRNILIFWWQTLVLHSDVVTLNCCIKTKAALVQELDWLVGSHSADETNKSALWSMPQTIISACCRVRTGSGRRCISRQRGWLSSVCWVVCWRPDLLLGLETKFGFSLLENENYFFFRFNWRQNWQSLWRLNNRILTKKVGKCLFLDLLCSTGWEALGPRRIEAVAIECRRESHHERWDN